MYCLYDGFTVLISYFLWRLMPSDFFVILEALVLQICLDKKILVKEKVLLQSSDERRPQIYPQHSFITQASIVQKQTPLIFLIRPRMGHWLLHKMLLQVGILRRLQHKKDRSHNSNTVLCVLKLMKSLSHSVYYMIQYCVICVLIGHNAVLDWEKKTVYPRNSRVDNLIYSLDIWSFLVWPILAKICMCMPMRHMPSGWDIYISVSYCTLMICASLFSSDLSWARWTCNVRINQLQRRNNKFKASHHVCTS